MNATIKNDKKAVTNGSNADPISNAVGLSLAIGFERFDQLFSDALDKLWFEAFTVQKWKHVTRKNIYQSYEIAKKNLFYEMKDLISRLEENEKDKVDVEAAITV